MKPQGGQRERRVGAGSCGPAPPGRCPPPARPAPFFPAAPTPRRAPQHKLSVPLTPSSAPGASRSYPAHSAHSGQPPPHDPPSPAPLSAPSGPADRPGRSAPASSDQVSRADAGRRPGWERWFGWLVMGRGGTRGGLGPRAIVQPKPEPQIWVPGSLEGRGGKLSGKPRPPLPPPPATGTSWSGEVGEPGDCPRCLRLSQCPRLGCQNRVLGAARFGEPATREFVHRAPGPGLAALWTPGSRSPGARRAPAPNRPWAGPPGARAGSCALCPRLRWIVKAVWEQSCVLWDCAP